MRKNMLRFSLLLVLALALAGSPTSQALQPLCFGCFDVWIPDGPMCATCLADMGDATGCIDSRGCTSFCAELFPGYCER
jgi:hypothetical protein